MKKRFSFILALTLMLSAFSFTAHAGTNGYYDLSYEAIKVASGDVNKLAVGDTFYAVIKLKDATALFGGQVDLSWDSSKITGIKDDETTAKNFNQATTDFFVNSTMVTDWYDEDVNAFESTTKQYKTSGSVVCDFSAATIVMDESEEGGFFDYNLDGDLTILKVRFKVLDDGDPNLKFTNARLREAKVDATRGAACTDSKYMTKSSDYSADGKYILGSKANIVVRETDAPVKGIKFKFSNGSDEATHDVMFSEDGTTTVKNGTAIATLNIAGVPADVTLTALAPEAITE